MSTIEHDLERAPRSVLRRSLSVFVAFLLALASLVGVSQAAHATQGITSTILLGGEVYDGTAVVNEGQTITLRVQYDSSVGAGTAVTFDLGANVTLTGVPGANTAIESVVQTGNSVTVTFRDPWSAGVNQGVFDLDFVVNDVDASVKGPITWQIDGEQSSVEVIVRNSGDQFANVTDGVAKTRTAPSNLNSFVSVDYATNTVTVNPTILGQDISYRLNVDSETARTGYTVADAPHAYGSDARLGDSLVRQRVRPVCS